MRMVIRESCYTTPFSRAILDRVDFAETVSTKNFRDDLETVGGLIFKKPPDYIYQYLRFRNVIRKLVGRTPKLPRHKTDYKVGGDIGEFKILFINENLLVLGYDKKFYQYRACLYIVKNAEYNIKLTSLHCFHSAIGRFYFKVVRFIHIHYIKNMVSRAYKA